MFNTISYCFYWTYFHSVKFFLWIVVTITPTSLVEGVVRKEFDSFGVKLTNGDKNKDKYDKKKYRAEIIVTDYRFYKDLAVKGGLMGLGETFMDEYWHSDDLVEVCSCLSDELRDKFRSNLWSKMQLSRNLQTRGSGSQRVMDDHYDLGNDLYEAMLDPYMNYEGAYWKDADTLDQAQINKMDLVARKLKLKPGMKVLDLGCGFGPVARYLAENYKVSIVAYNISKEQIKWARNKCKGLDIDFRLEDYRNATGLYDRVYTVGLLEHVGVHNYRTFYEVANRCLKPGGIMLSHTITLRWKTHPRALDWPIKYIFPNSELAYQDDFIHFSDGLFTVEDIHNFGYYYKHTLIEWRKNFLANWDKIKDNYAHRCNGKFKNMWIFYLDLCAGAFDSRTIGLTQVVYTKQRKDIYESVR